MSERCEGCVRHQTVARVMEESRNRWIDAARDLETELGLAKARISVLEERCLAVSCWADRYRKALGQVLDSDVVKSAPYVGYSEVIAEARAVRDAAPEVAS